MNERNRSPNLRYAKKHMLAWEGGKMLMKFRRKKKDPTACVAHVHVEFGRLRLHERDRGRWPLWT